MDFQSAMETFAEAWVAANAKGPLGDSGTQTQALALTCSKSPVTPPTSSHTEPNSSPLALSPQERRDNRSSTPTVSSAHITASAIDHTNATLAGRMSRSQPPSPVDKESFDLTKACSGKSLPLHCVVESTPALQDACISRATQWRRRALIETDSYVIIPTSTAFHDVVAAALQRLGYPGEALAMARGSVVIKNWKPLSLDLICDSSLSTVGEVLGELTAVATLRITVLRPPRPPGPSNGTPGGGDTQNGIGGPLAEVRDKLLRLLLLQSHGLLRSTGCPLDEITLSHLCRGNSAGATHVPLPEPPPELLRKFDAWFAAQLSPSTPPYAHPHAYNQRPRGSPSPRIDSEHQQLSNSLHPHHPVHQHTVHPALQTLHSQYPSQKTRMRTSFDPELELPKLQRWFNENQHPSRQQIQNYVRELNELESRRGRKPLDVNNVVYWFKNARAAQKRAELRGSAAAALGCHLGTLNGFGDNHSPYLKSPSSNNSACRRPPSAMSDDNLSNDGSEENQNGDRRPVTPDGPLSLTTRKEEIKEELDPDVDSPQDRSNNNNTKHSPSDQEDSEIDMEVVPSPPRLDISGQQDFRSPSPVDGVSSRDLAFPLVPNSMFSHSIMYMSHYIPGLGHQPGASPPSSSGLNLSALSEDRRKRNRTFIDPVTEVPRLEHWFTANTHPSHNLILKYTEELNRMPYRQKFPRLESKNVQFWFKNRRAKCKRLKMSLYEGGAPLGIPPYE